MKPSGGTRDRSLGCDRLDEPEMFDLEATGCMRILHGTSGKYALLPMRVARHSQAMDLFISPLSCSFAVHVACLEAELPCTLRRVERKTKLLADDGRDYRTIAPQGIVPAIVLPDGAILTETAAVLQFVADAKPERLLAPRWGTPERYRLIEWIHFISTELHKKHLFVAFSRKAPEVVKDFARSTAAATLAHPARHLADSERHPFLLGQSFTVADAYLFWALLIAPYGGISIDDFPSLTRYVERIRERPAVKQALRIELPLYTAEFGAPQAPPA
jgi:glutathione S-transferase